MAIDTWFAANPVVFPQPRDSNGWHARAIRGEFRWLKERPRDVALAIQTFGSLAAFSGLYAAWNRRLTRLVASSVVVMACNAWFLNRMAQTYGVDRTELLSNGLPAWD